jgi:hypothetical protein
MKNFRIAAMLILLTIYGYGLANGHYGSLPKVKEMEIVES